MKRESRYHHGRGNINAPQKGDCITVSNTKKRNVVYMDEESRKVLHRYLDKVEL